MTTVLKNAAQLVGIFDADERCRRGTAMRSPGVVDNGSLIMSYGRIDWLGPTAQLPPLPQDADIVDVSGMIVLPGFVDSHTHLIFAGSRENEFEQRLQGLSYQESTARGGGIMSTVRSVRQKTREELKSLAKPRLKRFLEFGVTTVEVKSGYGLSTADERKCLEAIAELNQEQPVELVPTFLGAHAVPPEYHDRRDEYIRLLLDEMLPDVAQSHLAVFCDVFCETDVFSVDESERILNRARDLGMQVKLHADELTPLGGAQLAAKLGATSADHLLCVSDAGIDALAASKTIATLLPGTAFFLGLPYAPARKLIERGVSVALASDCNPGTCPTENLALVGSMACTQMGMLPGEVITALTLNAAAALGRSDRVGSLCAGKQADVIVCDACDEFRVPAMPISFTTSGSTMSVASTSVAGPCTRLEPYRYQPGVPARPDDPRLGECIAFWSGGPLELAPGQPIVIGFPQDEGVRRNQGRPGAAAAPREIRRWLYRLSPWDVLRGADLTRLRPIDLGDLPCGPDLEANQQALGEIIAQVLAARAIPIVLGGGHETAFGHFLGYATARLPVGVINLDAHLDVRPPIEGLGHSGSPFWQALEHQQAPLRGDRYVCLGVQPHSVSREHLSYALQRGAVIRWSAQVRDSLCQHFALERKRLAHGGCPVYVTLDADVVHSAEVPGVSAPNAMGLSGLELIACARLAGESPNVTSFDVVEINPAFDRDDQSARWAALIVWYFLVGLAHRPSGR